MKHVTPSRFVILGHPRTGSTFLHLLLTSHPQIVVYGELFHHADEVRRAIAEGFGRPPLPTDEDPITYLEEHVYGAYPDDTLAVGFKLFYLHARNPEWEPLRDHLKSSEAKVIHIKRRNFLDRHLSEVLATRTNVWVVHDRRNLRPPESIELDAEACLRDFHKYLWFQQKADRFFSGSPVLELFYEDLAKHARNCQERLLDFLEVPFHELEPGTYRQQTKRRSEVIRNLAEVHETVAEAVVSGSAPEEWLSFFEERPEALPGP